MSLLIQISDTHFGTEVDAVVEALVRFVHGQRPDAVVLSGDITQRARRSQFSAARRFVERLEVPATVAIPGNHDIPLFNLPMRLFRPYSNYAREFGADPEQVFESEDFLVVPLKTTRRYRHKNGEVSDAQIERTARRLERASQTQLRIVVTHQPVYVTRPQDRRNLLIGHAEAVQRWAASGADLILGGHIHLPYVQALHEHYSGLGRPVWAVQAGTAVSSRVRDHARNSVNLIRYTSAGTTRHCVIERWDFSSQRQCFEPGLTHDLPCAASVGQPSHDS